MLIVQAIWMPAVSWCLAAPQMLLQPCGVKGPSCDQHADRADMLTATTCQHVTMVAHVDAQ